MNILNTGYLDYDDELDKLGSVKFLQKYLKNFEPEVLNWIQDTDSCQHIAEACPNSKQKQVASLFFKFLKTYNVITSDEFTYLNIAMITALKIGGIEASIIVNQIQFEFGGYALLKNMRRLSINQFDIDPLYYFEDYKKHIEVDDRYTLPSICLTFCCDYYVNFDTLLKRYGYLSFDTGSIHEYDPREFVRRVIENGGTADCLKEHFKFDNSVDSMMVLFEILKQKSISGEDVDCSELAGKYERAKVAGDYIPFLEKVELYFFLRKHKKQSPH